MTRLLVQSADGAQPLADLDSLQTFTIGRSASNDARFNDPAISSHHARLDRTAQGWTITDLDSANGTSVDGIPVTGTVPLAAPAEIVLGEVVVLQFTGDSAPAPRAPAPPVEASEADVALVRDMRTRTEQIRREVAKVIVGQVEIVDQVLMVLIAGGHGLLVGLPGMAKTTLVATIANVLDMAFRRVQFTPDLMPTDITGTEILENDPESGEKRFRFIKGPIFTNLLLADEINRTPPKTQAALLEAMQEKSVTVGNETYKLEPPFFVLATQNPIEQEGTYPLPEAQQDRFMFNLWVDYPNEQEEEQIVKTTTVTSAEKPQKVVSRQELLQLQTVVRKIPVSDHVIKYAIRLVRATRPGDEKAPDFIKKYVSNGAGPRAGQFLILAAKARAVLEGRIHVGCADVARAALPVLRHRILSNFAADSEGITPSNLVERLLKTVEQPGEGDY
jgi:MoxR-like ATPase